MPSPSPVVISLALTGAPPSLEEIRRLEDLAEGSDPVASWLDHLFADRRSADYSPSASPARLSESRPDPFSFTDAAAS